jgi:predicted deacylase
MNTVSLLSLLLVGSVAAQAFGDAPYRELLDEYSLLLTPEMAAHPRDLGFEVIGREGLQLRLLVPREDEGRFLRSFPAARLNVRAEEVKAELSAEAVGYRTLDQIEAHLVELTKRFPDRVALMSGGEVEPGKRQLVLKISDNVQSSEAEEPKLLVDAGMHGDEVVGPEVLLRLADELAEGSSERLQRLVNSKEIYLMPVVNVVGYSKGSRYEKGVDPNRDFPTPGAENYKTRSKCVELYRGFIDSIPFSANLTLHAYGRLVMFPWAYTTEPLADSARYQRYDELTRAMVAENAYRSGPISTTIYVANNSSVDYLEWRRGMVAVAAELGGQKAPPLTKLDGITNEAREMVWRFLEQGAR